MQVARYKRRFRHSCLGSRMVPRDDKSVTAERYFMQSRALTTDVILVHPLKDFVDQRSGFHAKPSATSSLIFIPLLTPGSDVVTHRGGSTPVTDDSRTVPVCSKKLLELNRQLTNNPHDIGSWLELVRIQNSEVGGDSLSQGSTPERVASAVTDVKAAILDRALEKNPTSIKLKLVQLELCHGRWEVEKMASEWKTMVFQHAGDPYVWKRYLRYVRSSFRTFSTSRVTSAYLRAISTLRGARDGTLLTHKAPPLVTTHMIGMCFIRDALM